MTNMPRSPSLRGIDLNLLVIFDALMTERHLSRAADRVGLSQPGVSHALRRLRYLTGDRLFDRHRDGMQPTPRALALAEPVGASLARLRRAPISEKIRHSGINHRIKLPSATIGRAVRNKLGADDPMQSDHDRSDTR